MPVLQHFEKRNTSTIAPFSIFKIFIMNSLLEQAGQTTAPKLQRPSDLLEITGDDFSITSQLCLQYSYLNCLNIRLPPLFLALRLFLFWKPVGVQSFSEFQKCEKVRRETAIGGIYTAAKQPCSLCGYIIHLWKCNKNGQQRDELSFTAWRDMKTVGYNSKKVLAGLWGGFSTNGVPLPGRSSLKAKFPFFPYLFQDLKPNILHSRPWLLLR